MDPSLNKVTLEQVYGIIKCQEESKRRRHIFPTSVLQTEIHNAIGIDPYPYLNDLYHDGRITYHRTLNQLSYNIKK